MGLAVGMVVGVSGGGVAPNTVPTNSVPGAQTVYVGNTLTFSSGGGNALAVADPDGGQLTVTLSVSNGTLSLSGTSGLTLLSGDGTADATMQFRGTAAAINAALAGATYTPTTGYAGADTLTLATNDGRGGIDEDTVAITVAFDPSNRAAYWKLSGLTDAFGSNTLSNNGQTTFGTGKLGNCAIFNGSAYLSIADNPALSMGASQSFHIDGFLKHTIANDNDIFLSKGGGGSAGQYEYTGRLNSSNQVVFDISNGTNETSFVASALGALSVDVWHYIALWHDAVNKIIGVQVNGSSVTTPWTHGCWDSGETFYLGTRAAGSFPISGSLDDFAIHKDTRNAAYRAARYDSGAGREIL